MTRKTLKAKIPADLIIKVRRAEGWTKVEGGQLSDIRRMNELYDVRVIGDHYVASPRA